MKIFCIGRNYADHAKELGNKVPSQPMVFMKPITALLKDNNDFYYPDFSNNVHFEVELVIKMSRHAKAIDEKFAHKCYEEIGLGIDFTARDLQAKLKEKGHPWEIAKSFDRSAVLSNFLPIDTLKNKDNIEFSLKQNGATKQHGFSKDLIFHFDTLIAHISKYILIQKGDLIYTGTPSGVGPVAIGDHLECFLEGNKMIDCKVK